MADLFLKFDANVVAKALSDFSGGTKIGQVVAGPDIDAAGFKLQRGYFQYGTGSTFTNGILLANDLYIGKKTISATSFGSVDLVGSTDKNYKGDDLAFTAVKFVLVAISDPDGTKVVRVGPQNQSNAWQGWFGGTGATVYSAEYWSLAKLGPPAGWSVTSGSADVLYLYNPGASSIDVNVAIVGVR